MGGTDEDFHQVKYVTSIDTVKTASQHSRPPQPMPECPEEEKCDDECACCCDKEKEKVPLKRTPDGKPVDEWADHPLAPSESAEQHLALAQEECPSPPCKAE